MPKTLPKKLVKSRYKYDIEKIFGLCDGKRTSQEIATLVGGGCTAKYVQEIMLKFDLPRLPQAPRSGKHNSAYKGGRRVAKDGYVYVVAPEDHPHVLVPRGKTSGRIFEHRLVMEQHLGRYLDPKEVVDHIDGLTLHNCPKNLRIFESNSAHLQATLSGQVPQWSQAALEKQNVSYLQRTTGARIDTYGLRKKRGDLRLLQILRAALQLGIDSPYLLGTTHHLENIGIFDFSHSNLTLELEKLNQRLAQDLL